MTHPARDPAILDAVALLNGYGFDLDGFAADYLVSYWAVNHPAHWIRGAIVEALYQGRYRAVSVGQILAVWRRRGQPIPHYTPDFERVVSGRFGGFAVAPVANRPAGVPASASAPNSPVAEVAPAAPAGGAIAGDAAATENSGPRSEAIAPSSEAEQSQSEAPEDPGNPDASPQSDEAAADKPRLETSEEDDSFAWWGRGSAAQNPIHQYVPIIPRIEASAFYAKLRAVAYGSEADEAPTVLVAEGERFAHRPTPESPYAAEKN
ncbi:MAG: hypothetical protein OHK0037_33910 [Elainellaceae cyanobacterium]